MPFPINGPFPISRYKGVAVTVDFGRKAKGDFQQGSLRQSGHRKNIHLIHHEQHTTLYRKRAVGFIAIANDIGAAGS
ncbi:MAG: hypothetical protein JWP88_1749 [Flaviaesturariibacter sp.]|nr:hypothetical protein [Flaviaesturariibacter sp.]